MTTKTLDYGLTFEGEAKDIVPAGLEALKEVNPTASAILNWDHYRDFGRYAGDDGMAINSVFHDMVRYAPEDGTATREDHEDGSYTLKIIRLDKAALEAWNAMKRECEKTGLPTRFLSDLAGDRYFIHKHKGAPFVWVLFEDGTHLVPLECEDAEETLEAVRHNVTFHKRGMRTFWYLWNGYTLIPDIGPCNMAHAQGLLQNYGKL